MLERKLENKVAVITGADSGIGRSIAEAFANEGATVVITYHADEARANTFSKELSEKNQKHGVYQLDVADENDVKLFFRSVMRTFKKVDILVNNAGAAGSNSLVRDMATEAFDRCVKTNLYGPFFCSRAYLSVWHDAQQYGRIINITSIHEDIAAPGGADYSASKGGLKNFSKSLALELAPLGITVNNIAPGMILTDMNSEALNNEEVKKAQEENIPAGRAGIVGDINAAAVFLASGDSSYVTGSTIFIDGGLRINLGQGA